MPRYNSYEIPKTDTHLSLLHMVEMIFADRELSAIKDRLENYFFQPKQHPSNNPIFVVAAAGITPIEFANISADDIAENWIDGGFFDPKVVGEEQAREHMNNFCALGGFDDIDSEVLEVVMEELVKLAYDIENYIGDDLDDDQYKLI